MNAMGSRRASTSDCPSTAPASLTGAPSLRCLSLPGQRGQSEWPSPRSIAHSKTLSRSAAGSPLITPSSTISPVNRPTKLPACTASAVNSPCSSRPGIDDRAMYSPLRWVAFPFGRNICSFAPRPPGPPRLSTNAARCARAAIWIRASTAAMGSLGFLLPAWPVAPSLGLAGFGAVALGLRSGTPCPVRPARPFRSRCAHSAH